MSIPQECTSLLDYKLHSNAMLGWSKHSWHSACRHIHRFNFQRFVYNSLTQGATFFLRRNYGIRGRRLCTNYWGNAATAFSLSSSFHVYGCVWYKLYSGKRRPGRRKAARWHKHGPQITGFDPVAIAIMLAIARYCESTCNQFISLEFLQAALCVSANACLRVSTLCCETQHHPKLYTPSHQIQHCQKQCLEACTVLASWTRITIVEAPS